MSIGTYDQYGNLVPTALAANSQRNGLANNPTGTAVSPTGITSPTAPSPASPSTTPAWLSPSPGENTVSAPVDPNNNQTTTASPFFNGNIITAGPASGNVDTAVTTALSYTPTATPTTDPVNILAWIKQYASQAGMDPSLAADPNYWAQRIAETGGLSSANAQYWIGRFQGQGGDTPPGATAPAAASAPIAVGPSPTVTTPGTGNTSTDPAQNALYNQLLARAGQSEVVDPNDPVIKGQTDAYAASEQRALRTYLQGLAESAGPNANISAETRLGNEQAGQATSSFQATAMVNELTARRNEIQSALTSMQGMLTSEQAANLQAQLATMNDALSRLGISVQQNEFGQTLGQNAYQFDTNQADRLAGF